MVEQRIHNEIRRKISNCIKIEDFCELYQDEEYQGCLRRLEQAQLGHGRIEWSKSWAKQLSDSSKNKNADDLNRDRKTSLELLYGICNRWKPSTSTKEESQTNVITETDIVRTFKPQKIQRILILSLPMDRANALYNMINSTTNKRGLPWYAKEDTEQFQKEYGTEIVRTGGHTINKRLRWLFEIDDLHLYDDPNLSKWIQPVILSDDGDGDDGNNENHDIVKPRGIPIEDTPSNEIDENVNSNNNNKKIKQGSHTFISYSRRDTNYAQNLKKEINRYGFDVWMDDKTETGTKWANEINNAIRSSSAFVVVMSDDSNQSEWVQKEILLAKRYQKPILPILLRGEEFPILIDSQFDDVTQTQSLPEPSFYRRLRKEVYGDDGAENKNIPSPSDGDTGDTEESNNNNWAGIGSGSWVIGASILIVILALTLNHSAPRRK